MILEKIKTSIAIIIKKAPRKGQSRKAWPLIVVKEQIETENKLLFENIKPTPIPTPASDTRGILDAKYLNPNNIIKKSYNK